MIYNLGYDLLPRVRNELVCTTTYTIKESLPLGEGGQIQTRVLRGAYLPPSQSNV